eukprot:snap_masked-scaffold10_size831480-processed-gene-3.7 protein:Tk01819 transcript:snap_masked-scaffold10_size831480-processed-gene-3.7-mRNA-1 annotation:"peptidyl-prolyl cis-trans isomerase-like 4"
MAVVIETTLGAFTVDLYLGARPQVCENFLKLCQSKFYHLCLFHNVQSGYLAQTGDPEGTGRGGQAIYRELYGPQARYFQAERLPRLKHERPALLAMVNVGDGLVGSQFFLTLGAELDALDHEGHCVFGEVTEGLDIVEAFNAVIADESHRPYRDVRITHTVILADPYPHPAGLLIPPASPDPRAVLTASDRLAADQSDEDDEADGLTDEARAERQAQKEAQAQATILEMVGDLPEADCAPPENVLFVCKLNPVTTDDDLETIFSRFGRVVSCEVIRDRQSNDSLQYAFVEFDQPEACERAYFKMDNVLIDDRRIHVDFSQSVSKFQWRGKGRLTVRDEAPAANRTQPARAPPAQPARPQASRPRSPRARPPRARSPRAQSPRARSPRARSPRTQSARAPGRSSREPDGQRSTRDKGSRRSPARQRRRSRSRAHRSPSGDRRRRSRSRDRHPERRRRK